MKKIKLVVYAFFSSYALHAQVGIGTTNPQAALDITATTDGLLVPRVALFDMVTATIDTPTLSELVYNTATSGLAPNNVTPGFYYWDGLKWLRIKSSTNNSDAWSLEGNSGIVDANNFIGTTDDAPFNIRVNNQKAGRVTSSGSVFFGYQAGNVNTEYSNTGIGFNSLLSNTVGVNNTGVGYNTLRDNTGSYNTATGFRALYFNTTGFQNTAYGNQSMLSNTIGTYNTATGSSSLALNTTGYSNTATGSLALYSNSTGYENTANGLQSLRNNTTGFQNTAIGHNSLFSNTTGTYNTATGTSVLYSNTTGYSNTATGSLALLFNSTGYENTANGLQALRNNTTGLQNTAIGHNSLFSNSTGNFNTALGGSSLYSNTTGYNNTAAGIYALNLTTTGNELSAFGAGSLRKNTTGSRNSAFGSDALRETTTGTNNVALGAFSLTNQTTAIGNTAVGFFAGTTATSLLTGNFNTLVGYTASSDNSARTNCIALAGNGNLTFGGDNRVRIGNNLINSIGGQVGWTTISDQRVKKNIKQDVKGLDFILKLKPVTYNYSIEKSNQIQKKKIEEEWPTKHNIEKMRFSGFLAQEVQKTAKLVGYDFSGVDKPEDADGLWGLRYSEFTVPLVKAFQELNEQNQKLKESNSTLTKQVNDLLLKMEQQEKTMQLLEKKIQNTISTRE